MLLILVNLRTGNYFNTTLAVHSNNYFMRHQLITLIFLTTLLFSCSTKSSKEIVIKGQLGNVADGTIVHLFENDADEPFMIDTIADNRFEFVFQDTIVNSLREMNVVIYDGKPVLNSISFWVQSPTQIELNASEPYFWEIKSNIKEQKEANEYFEINKDLKLKLSKTLLEINKAVTKMEESSDDTEFNSLSNVVHNIHDSIAINEIAIWEKTKTYSDFWYTKLSHYAQTIYQNENSPIKERVLAVYNNLSDEQKQNKIIEEVNFLLYPPKALSIGDKYIDIDLQDINEQSHSIADYEGKYRLLDFWASWCGPCIAATPEVSKMAEKYKNELVVIAINVEGKKNWLKYSKENKMLEHNLHLITDSKKVDHSYQIKGIPHYVLIAPNGTIVDMWSGYGKGSIEAKMKEHLKK